MELQKRLRPALTSFLLEDAVELGQIERGAYSSIVKVRWQGTEFSGKKLHDLPLRLEKKKGEEILTRLKKHCELMSSLRHPNIVQYIGVCLSSADAAPILVNEPLTASVASTLESHTRFPLSVQLSVLQDVAQGLAFLHCRSRPLVHGSLSGNNILLSRGLQAKIGDLGVAAVLDPSTGKLTVTMSKTPELASYTSPELLSGLPSFQSPANDVFSYGILVLHIASGQWPIPEGEVKSARELDRRKSYIDSIPQNHCLISMISDCLHNDPLQRPQTLSLVERLTRLTAQNPIPYKTGLDLMLLMERRESELLSMVDQLKAGQEEVEGIGKRLSNYDTQLAAVKEQMKSMEEQLVSGLKDNNPQIIANSLLQPPDESCIVSNTITVKVSPPYPSSPILKPTQSVFHWKRASNAPIGMHSASAVTIEGKLYIGGGETKDLQTDRMLYEFDMSGMVHKWTALPICPVAYFSLGMVNKSLVLVGGLDIVSRKTSNKLYMWDRDRQEWCATLPPMPTPRQNPAVATHNLLLIVAGGYRSKKVLSEVEMFDQATFQWQSLPNLPLATSCASCCVIRDILYILGGTWCGDSGPQTAVQALSLSGDLSHSIWSTVKDAPLTMSHAVPSRNFLLAVGGSMPGSNTPTNMIHVYFPALDKWDFLCEMPTPRAKCVAAVLSAGRMIVVGGREENVHMIECGTTIEVLSV